MKQKKKKMRKNSSFLNDISKSVLDFVKENPFLVILLLSALILRMFLNRLFPSQDEPRVSKGNTDYEVVPEDTKGSKMSKSEARTKAEQLFKAMNVFGGTDEAAIFNVLTGISKADYNMIYNAFGIRSYSTILGESTVSWLGTDLDLNGWLAYELDSSEMAELKRKNPNLPL